MMRTRHDVVIVEGFQAFYDPCLFRLMSLRLWLDIDEPTALRRRVRKHPRSNLNHMQTYVHQTVWPHHLAYKNLVLERTTPIDMIDATQSQAAVHQDALARVLSLFERR